MDKLEYFYHRNLFNDEQEQLIFIWEEGITKVNILEVGFKCENITSKVIKKELILSDYPHQSTSLSVTFENGDSLLFENINDSNNEYSSEYTEEIKAIYKLL
ncbi:hypothetical protein ACQKM9_21365 [Viridibacillus sp. NPDC093762]|uniref:hypothetical protein n=1 Tax=Viridibacillus sp. NPDC093762 TaxID=3390720 RepID=UPI003CFCF8F7